MERFSYRNGTIGIGPEIASLFPDLAIGCLEARIRNGETHPDLWRMIRDRTEEISGAMDEESIRNVEGIRAGKQAYRHLGKDPNRYRLSAEALMRRAAKGKGLYSITAAVDALNLVSLRTGITIGGFDAGCVNGDVQLGIGLPGEEFFAIGRGPLNVENLPVYRDHTGVIGNPTSDSERTQINLTTTHVLMLITGFYGRKGPEEALEQLISLLTEFCQATDIKTGFTDI